MGLVYLPTWMVDVFNGKCRLNIYQSHGSLGIWPPMNGLSTSTIFPIFLRPRKRHPPGAKAHSVAFPLCHCAQDFFHPGWSLRRNLAVAFLSILRLGLFERKFEKKPLFKGTHWEENAWKWWWRIQIKTENIQNDPYFFWKASSAKKKTLMVEIHPRTFFVSVVPLFWAPFHPSFTFLQLVMLQCKMDTSESRYLPFFSWNDTEWYGHTHRFICIKTFYLYIVQLYTHTEIGGLPWFTFAFIYKCPSLCPLNHYPIKFT